MYQFHNMKLSGPLSFISNNITTSLSLNVFVPLDTNSIWPRNPSRFHHINSVSQSISQSLDLCIAHLIQRQLQRLTNIIDRFFSPFQVRDAAISFHCIIKFLEDLFHLQKNMFTGYQYLQNIYKEKVDFITIAMRLSS